MSFKRPESVLVIIFTQDSQVLLLKRVHPEHFWQSVTGSLDEGESAIHAASRELTEETGLTATPSKTVVENCYPIIPAWRSRYAPNITHNHEVVFTVELSKTCDIRLNQFEHSRYVWLPREQAAAKVSSWTNRDAILSLVPDKG